MCVVNQIPARKAAKTLDLDPEQTLGAVRLLKSCERVPSPERLAVTVMLDPGLDNQDIAQIFGRSVRWARVVRSQKDEIREEEFIALPLEYLDDGLQPDMPTPEELARKPPPKIAQSRPQGPRSNIRVYTYQGAAFAGLQEFTH